MPFCKLLLRLWFNFLKIVLILCICLFEDLNCMFLSAAVGLWHCLIINYNDNACGSRTAGVPAVRRRTADDFRYVVYSTPSSLP